MNRRRRSLRRPRHVVAFGLMTAAVGATLAWALLPRPTQPLASPAVVTVDPGSLLVLPVAVEKPAPESDWLREGLAEMIRSQLGQTPGLQVVSGHRLAAALPEVGARAASPGEAMSLARQMRAEHVVSGSFARMGERFVVSANVIDVAGGRTEGSASARGRMPADLLDAVDELCLKLLHHLAPQGRAAGSRRGPVRLATRSVEASRSYMEAVSRFARGGRPGAEEAEALLDHALKLDASFAQAYLKEAEIRHWRRRWGYGSPDPAPAVRAAARLMKELPNREKLLVESFEALIIHHAAAADDLLTAFEQTPHRFGSAHQGLVNGDLAALYYAAVARQKLGEYDKAEPLLERLIAHCRRLQHLPGYDAGTAAGWQASSFMARARARLGREASEPPRLEGDDTTYFVQSARLHPVHGRTQDALRALAQGVALGHGELRHIEDDPDFDSLRGEPEFQRLVSGR